MSTRVLFAGIRLVTATNRGLKLIPTRKPLEFNSGVRTKVNPVLSSPRWCRVHLISNIGNILFFALFFAAIVLSHNFACSHGFPGLPMDASTSAESNAQVIVKTLFLPAVRNK
jgi:hypothetical protein